MTKLRLNFDMKTINLYPDQQDLVSRVRSSMATNTSVLMQSATGSGKTIMGAGIIQSAYKKGSHSIFIVPRRELMRQTAETFNDFGIEFGYVAAGKPSNPFAKVHLATCGTLGSRLDRPPKADLLLIDETHFGAGQLDLIIQHYKARGSKMIGLSATPSKLSGKGLGNWYSHMECGPSIAELIKTKRLSEYRLFAPSAPDLSGIKTTAGDYAKGELAERMEGDSVLIGSAVQHYKKHAMGKLNVAFCTSIKHAEITSKAFNLAGIPSAVITGKMNDEQRARRIKAFARREILVLCNVDLLTFGFDLASAAQMDVTVECMSDLRPTKSVALQLQKWGRVLRYKETPALIFDHAGNSDPDKHGLPDEDRDWTLKDKVKRGGGNAEPTMPVRQCPDCFMVHRPAPTCPGCGFLYPVQSRIIEEIEGELSEVDRLRKTKKKEQGQARTMNELVALGKSRGMKNPYGWASNVIKSRKRR